MTGNGFRGGPVAALFLASILAGCSTLPADGPQGDVINKAAVSTISAPDGSVTYKYVLADLTMEVLNNTKDYAVSSLFKSFGGGRGGPPEIRVGVGDTVQVSIFESSDGGLFIPKEAGSRPGNFVTLPSQTVDRAGSLTVPYAGLVPAAGRSLPEIQQDIEQRLANRAIEPQAVVAMISQQSNAVSVVGEVNSANRFTITSSGDRVVDMIAKAGGLKNPDYESFVTLQRRKKAATVFYKALITNPVENIYVAPGDTIDVYREQRSFLAYGASGQTGQFNFDSEKVTYAEAVARAGGLLDDRADPAQSFIYRLEDRRTLEKMGVDLTPFPPEKKQIPTIYRANFRDPSSFFVAQRFAMHDKDVIYVSNAKSVELYKFLTLINSVSSTASGVTSDALTVRSGIRTIAK
jgi:polysaccharide export outer membrane protein